MNYPFWDVPVSYGVLMAVIAVFHVFVSHFAIGGGLYLVVSEHLARKAGDARRLEFLERLSKFFVLTTLVAGALTGVGIWFIIGLISPTATEALIHNYVWGWATEWTFFVVEIAAAMIYFYGWKTMAPRAHMAVGWIYFVFAWLSLFIINGIVTFMLTPGQWLATGDFWDGFFNPTFWPSLVLRTGVCVMLAGLYALLVVARCEAGGFKERTVRWSAGWGVAGLAVTAVCQYWYWKAIPAAVTAKALQTMPTPIHSMEISVWLAVAIGALLVVFGLLAPRKLGYGAAAALMVLGLAWFGAFEWFRESIRKPYILAGYIYGNGVEVAQADRYKKEGLLAQMAFKTGDDGADLFRHACQSCHMLNGYKALKPAFDGMDRAFIAAIVRATHQLKGNMPPFPGTAAEAEKIAGYLGHHTDKRPLAEIYKLEGVELGRKAYAIRCGVCHVIGAASDKSQSFAGQSADDLNNMLNTAADLGEGMPAYTGDAAERKALVAFLQELGKGGKK
ncbi:MAG: c-type cytochrome [Verrucomicrobia bacterium]|nr:c-type cytochrome [Verrucomicrobiota bacterium]